MVDRAADKQLVVAVVVVVTVVVVVIIIIRQFRRDKLFYQIVQFHHPLFPRRYMTTFTVRYARSSNRFVDENWE